MSFGTAKILEISNLFYRDAEAANFDFLRRIEKFISYLSWYKEVNHTNNVPCICLCYVFIHSIIIEEQNRWNFNKLIIYIEKNVIVRLTKTTYTTTYATQYWFAADECKNYMEINYMRFVDKKDLKMYLFYYRVLSNY